MSFQSADWRREIYTYATRPLHGPYGWCIDFSFAPSCFLTIPHRAIPVSRFVAAHSSFSKRHFFQKSCWPSGAFVPTSRLVTLVRSPYTSRITGLFYRLLGYTIPHVISVQKCQTFILLRYCLFFNPLRIFIVLIHLNYYRGYTNT